MEQNKVNTFAAKFKKAFSEAVLNELGKATRYCHRVRQLTPYRMVMTLIALFAGTRVESLADLQRGFNALFGYAMDYKPFYDQLAKREFATFMRETARRLLETLVIRVLGVAPGGAFSEFRRIVIQDGSSFAIKDALKEVFPGRFKKVKPAAVELHATLDLLEESLSKVTLTADTASERAALPKASSLGGCLLMADRGYFDRDYLLELTKAGASFVIRAQKGLNPKVLEAFDAQGQRIPRFLANRSRRCASRSGGRSICVCAGRSRVSPLNAVSLSRGTHRPGSFNTWPPTSRPSATPSMKWPRPIACAGRWSSCSRNGSPMRTCMPSIPRTPPSSKDSSGPPSAPLR